ncbi:NITA [Symbiodinium sp. CCMP2592]|nr:NITA [Symbiodinium sp. CCMP2592]
MEATRDGKIVDGRIELSTALWDTSLEMPGRQDATEVDARDANTPDKWIKRHPDMLRNTGMHPFNSEPPLKNLQAAGWITPPALYVVRNHGAVPQLSWSEHRLKITGVPKPVDLSMEQIASGEWGTIVSIPVTFICAGNRRKEQNLTKKTVGFDWGAGAVGNSVWTGVRLCDLLAAVGITRPSKEHRFVHFEGPLGELPQGKTGSYGTSIDLGWALDRERDVLLAFKQNGELLTPDHGFPLRTLLPGCIGGRMIKWLSSMWVSDKPSENHYHYFDNRVLPPHVDADLAYAEGWWYKPEYIINHMNINSAMFEPRHNSFVQEKNLPKTIKVSGYGYTGGGHKIIRAEISLDSGKSWEITELQRPEDEIAEARGTDKHWCWAWWETEVDMSRLLDSACEEICCRAWDSNQNCQPVQLTWTVMGMLNNPIYRIKIHREGGRIWFEHPTQGSMPGGWMTDQAGQFNESFAVEATPGKTGVAPSRPVAAVWKGAKIDSVSAAGASSAGQAAAIRPTKAGKLVQSTEEWLAGISMEEVKKHDNEKSCWFVVKGNVYDGTPYLQDHPGGASSILLAGGLEATEDFEAVHSTRAWEMLKDYYLGPLKEAEHEPEAGVSQSFLSMLASPLWYVGAALLSPFGSSVPFLNPRESQQLELSEKIVVNHDTRIFRFKLPSPSMTLGLPTGMHMTLKAKVDGKPVMRAYTPMTDDSTLGHVDLLVKVYFKGVHPSFPDGGKMSQHLDSMKIGDSIDVKGPIGEFVYKGQGQCLVNGKPRFVTEISMIAGGTGITPCYQVLAAILRDPEDKTTVRLLFANRTPDDILARDVLEELAAKHPDRFMLSFTVDKVPSEDENVSPSDEKNSKSEWKGHVGFVTPDMTKATLFPASEETVCLMCGPPVMLEKACIPALHSMGYKDSNVFSF